MIKTKYLLSAAILFLFLGSCKPPILIEDTEIKLVYSRTDRLLKKYEKADRIFKRIENKKLNMVSYFYRRKIGEAIVEKDYIRYVFDSKSKKLIEETRKWRKDLPEIISPIFTHDQAESMVKGKVVASKLYLISPQSQVFCIEPAPQNPCWIVWSKEEGVVIISIIDSITGMFLGYGIPPPYNAFAFHCTTVDGWKKWRDNADEWFEKMGYSSKRSNDPCSNEVKGWIQSDYITLFYEISHGGESAIHQKCNNCAELTAHDIETWIDSYASMPFTFLASCFAMNGQADDTLSFEFRKGSDIGTVVVGYYGMSDNPCESDCWPDSLDWQDKLLSLMNDGWPVGYAFDRANLEFPDCTNCMRIAGDRLMAFAGGDSSKVERSLSGELYDIKVFNSTIHRLPGVYSRMGYRPYYIRSDIHIPSSRSLDLLPSTNRTIIDLFFMNNSKMNCDGLLQADGRQGEILLVSAEDRRKGIRIKGEIRASNGAQIKIYE